MLTMKIQGWTLLLLIVGLLLTGCSAHINSKSAVIKEINFKEVQWYAGRAKAAYGTEKEIREAYPETVRVATVGNTDVQYFLEIFPDKKV